MLTEPKKSERILIFTNFVLRRRYFYEEFLIYITHIIILCCDNPRVIEETKHQEMFNINKWIGVSGNNLLGPLQLLLIEGDCLNFLQNILQDLLDDINLNIRQNLWFFQSISVGLFVIV